MADKKFDVVLLARRVEGVEAPSSIKYGEVVQCPDANNGEGAVYIGRPDGTPMLLNQATNPQELYLTVPEQASDLFISTKETNRKIPWTTTPRAANDVCYRIGDDITLSPDGKDITLPMGTFDIWYRIHFSTMEGYAVIGILDSSTLEPLNKSSVGVAEPGKEPGKIRESIGRAVFFVTSPITISVGVEYADSNQDKRLSWWECWCHIQKR
ncbi:hypothetical protein SPB21_22460 [Leptothoe sp. ISB3NOV94-8A]